MDVNVAAEEKVKKRFLIVTGPVCSGKTTLALNIAANYPDCFYFDKDDLIPVSHVVFTVANQECDRHSKFFNENIRCPEYDATNQICVQGIRFNSFVIVNAPYTSELKAEEKNGSPALAEIKKKLMKENAEFIVVYIKLTPEELKKRLEKRKNTPDAMRDTYIYNDLDAYIRKCNLTVPDLSHSKNIDKFFVFDAMNRDSSYKELMKFLGISGYKCYNQNIQASRNEKSAETASEKA